MGKFVPGCLPRPDSSAGKWTIKGGWVDSGTGGNGAGLYAEMRRDGTYMPVPARKFARLSTTCRTKPSSSTSKMNTAPFSFWSELQA